MKIDATSSYGIYRKPNIGDGGDTIPRGENMKIDATSSYGIYRKPNIGDGGDTIPIKKKNKTTSLSKTDVADFSRGNTSVADKSLASLKANLQHDISRSSSPQRIQQLREQVRSGQYHISTDELVDAILKQV